MYSELKTFRYYDKEGVEQRVLKEADNYFDSIFKAIKDYSLVCLTIFLVILLINISMQLLSIYKGITISISIAITPLIFLVLKFRREPWSFWISTFQKFKNDKPFRKLAIANCLELFYPVIVVASILIFVSFILNLASLQTSRNVEVELRETKQIPIEIKLQNNEAPQIYIEIISESKPKENVNIKVKKNELKYSSTQVIEVDNRKFYNKVDNKIKEGNWNQIDGFSLKNLRYSYRYSGNLQDYVEDGRNELKVIILPSGDLDSQRIIFITTIDKHANNIEIAEKRFRVTP